MLNKILFQSAKEIFFPVIHKIFFRKKLVHKTELDKGLLVLFFFILFTQPNILFSQVDSQWVKRYNGSVNGTDVAQSVAVDEEGNVFVGGLSTGVLTSSDFTTIKYNSAGVQQWIHKYNGPGNAADEINSVAVDKNSLLSNVYVTGNSFGNGTNSDFATIKYNSSGDTMWVRRYNGPANGIDHAISIKVDNSGFVYVTGHSEGIGSGYDYVTIKYNSSGSVMWIRRYNSPLNSTDFVSALTVDNSGNVYVTGLSAGIGFFDYATIKYNSNGDSLWVKRYNGTGNSFDQGLSIAVDDIGNVYVTGGSPGVSSGADFGTIKYNSNGVQQWFQSYIGPGNGSDIAQAIAVSNSGNVYVTGHSLGVGTIYDYATVKYNSDGIQQWIQRYNGPGNGIDRAFSLVIDEFESVYISGFSSGGSSNSDYAIVKYNSDGLLQWVQRYDGPDGRSDAASSLHIDNSGNVYVTGQSDAINTSSDFATIKYTQAQVCILDLKAFIEGFYNSSDNLMVADTMKVYLRNTFVPYSLVDSAKALVDSTGKGTFHFVNALNGVSYYIAVKHRNSIETWSGSGVSFVSNQLNYDFTTSSSQAYGSNLILKGNKFTIYSGDVNQDGIVDASDLSLTDNDAYNQSSGYLNTDVNGDNFIDASDISLIDNNVFNSVSIRRP